MKYQVQEKLSQICCCCFSWVCEEDSDPADVKTCCVTPLAKGYMKIPEMSRESIDCRFVTFMIQRTR